MARLRNIKSGVVVNVADEKVERLNRLEWEPVGAPAKTPAPKKAAAKKAAAKPSES